MFQEFKASTKALTPPPLTSIQGYAAGNRKVFAGASRILLKFPEGPGLGIYTAEASGSKSSLLSGERS